MKVATEDRPTPDALREGVRSAVVNAIATDAEQRGGRTGARLVLSGLLGVGGALAVTWLVAAHPMGHHPTWHLAFVSTVWAGLLVVVLALALLDVRTPHWPVGHAARAGVLALVIAGVCGYACPDQHFLHWWDATRAGGWITQEIGTRSSAFCFGLVAIGAFAFLAALPTLPGRPGASVLLITATVVALLMAPGIALQSTNETPGHFAAWMGGAAIGSIAGVGAAIGVRGRRDADTTRVAPTPS